MTIEQRTSFLGIPLRKKKLEVDSWIDVTLPSWTPNAVEMKATMVVKSPDEALFVEKHSYDSKGNIVHYPIQVWTQRGEEINREKLETGKLLKRRIRYKR